MRPILTAQGDQGYTAHRLQDLGAGLWVNPHAFTEHEFKDKLARVASDPSFPASLSRLNVAARAGGGGAERAADVVSAFHCNPPTKQGPGHITHEHMHARMHARTHTCTVLRASPRQVLVFHCWADASSTMRRSGVWGGAVKWNSRAASFTHGMLGNRAGLDVCAVASVLLGVEYCSS